MKIVLCFFYAIFLLYCFLNQLNLIKSDVYPQDCLIPEARSEKYSINDIAVLMKRNSVFKLN